MALAPGTQLGPYEVLGPLGAGGMGEVYEARDTRLDRTVAVKVLPSNLATDREHRARVEREARAISHLNHPHICTLHDVGTHEGATFLVMEYLVGETLADRLQAGRLPLEQALTVATEIADALAAAHRQGIVHRDLKPGNVMLTKSGAKLLDFGLAKLRRDGARSAASPLDSAPTQSAPLTTEGTIVGTLHYMAPEQLEGKPADARTDLWALGAILYEMVAGRRAFDGTSAADVIGSTLKDDPPPLLALRPSTPPALQHVVQKCLAKAPDARWQTADDARDELRWIGRELQAGSSGAMSPGLGGRRRRPLVAALVLAAVAVAAAVLVSVSIGRMRDRAENSPGDRPSIAVLPLKNLSGDPSQDYFSDGVTEEIISRLAVVPGLKVISRTSVDRYKNSVLSLKAIASELDVTAVLEGSVRRDANRVRVTVQLIDARSDNHMWAESYDRQLSDIFTVQSDVAANIAGALKANLTPEIAQRLERQPTDSVEAYELYLRGNQYGQSNIVEQHVRAAADLYERAVEADPRFALAYAGLAEAHGLIYWYHWDRSASRVALAKTAVDRALELAPDLPEAHRALGYYYYWCFLDYDRALDQFAIARRAKPGDWSTLSAIGYIERRRGRMRESIDVSLEGLAANPHWAFGAFSIGQTYSLIRRFEEADRLFDRALAESPDFAIAYARKAAIRYRLTRDLEGAKTVMNRADALGLGQDPWVRHNWVLLEISAGDYQRALDLASTAASEEFVDALFVVPRALLEARAHDLMHHGEEARRNYERACADLRKKIAADPEQATYHSSLGLALAGLGRKEEAIREGNEAVRLLPVEKEAWAGAVRLEDLARIYARTGSHDAAVAVLEQLVSIPNDLGVAALQLDPDWAPLRGLPRFQELMRRLEQ